MKLPAAFLAAVIFFTACKEKKQSETLVEKNNDLPVNSSVNDSVEIRNAITGFYNWYGSSYSKLMGYKLYNSLKKKDAPPYRINWDEVTRYQQFIHDSVPYLGEEFLVNQKKFFGQADSAFKVDVNDDIPYGFDYDWYTNSQDDPKYLVDEINKQHAWDMIPDGGLTKVNIKGNYDPSEKTPVTILTVWMKKENDKWKIARIGME